MPHVAFLWENIDSPTVLDSIEVEEDTAIYIPGAIIFNVEMKNWSKNTVYRYINAKIYQHVTMRNINTVRKLTKLLKNVSYE
jgi:uncharacterized protein (DUF1697 family)